MRLSDLDYDLPSELIAQEPAARRDEARLEVVNRKTGAIEHSRFYKLGRYLQPRDVMVLNDTRVFPPACWCARKAAARSSCSSSGRPTIIPAPGWR